MKTARRKVFSHRRTLHKMMVSKKRCPLRPGRSLPLQHEHRVGQQAAAGPVAGALRQEAGARGAEDIARGQTEALQVALLQGLGERQGLSAARDTHGRQRPPRRSWTQSGQSWNTGGEHSVQRSILLRSGVQMADYLGGLLHVVRVKAVDIR
jgi:hypothetical protein